MDTWNGFFPSGEHRRKDTKIRARALDRERFVMDTRLYVPLIRLDVRLELDIVHL